MNNKRNISFLTAASVLATTILVIVSCSGLNVVNTKMTVSEDAYVIEKNYNSTIPNFDLNNYLLDSSVQEELDRVVNFTQKSVNASTTITSENTAISIEFNCPDRLSKTVLVPEPTIFPAPILKLVPSDLGKDFHEIEFSLYAAFNKLNDNCRTGLGFDFSGSLMLDNNKINPLAIVIV